MVNYGQLWWIVACQISRCAVESEADEHGKEEEYGHRTGHDRHHLPVADGQFEIANSSQFADARLLQLRLVPVPEDVAAPVVTYMYKPYNIKYVEKVSENIYHFR